MSRISDQSILEIKDAAIIEEVVAAFVPSLKKKGSAWIGLCPFHNEKTPSFNVTPAKGIFKCFGCGKAGDSIAFLEEHEKMTYPEALRWLAAKFNVAILDAVGTKETEAIRKANDDYAAVTRGALGNYIKALHARPDLIMQILVERNITKETLLDFQIGLAPDEWKFLTTPIIAKGYYQPASKLGIIRTKDENHYDFFRNRVMVPIFNTRSNCVAFGGRKFEDGNKENTKYLNSPECKGFWEKGRALFGLNLATKAIKEQEFSILVEGYWDCIALHDKGYNNTVASMGTSFTDEQAKLLGRYTKTVLIAQDNDAAGQESAFNAVDTLLKQGIEPLYLPILFGTDPDSLVRELLFLSQDTYNNKPGISPNKLLQQYIVPNTVDAVIWKIDQLIKPNDTPTKRGLAIEAVTELLRMVKSDTVRNEYVSHCKKAHDVKIVIKGSKDDAIDISEKEVNQRLAHLKWLTKDKKEEAFFKDGFTICEDLNEFGYWFAQAGFHLERMTNFVIKPMFSINEPDDKFELVEIRNRYNATVLEVPIGGFTSMDKFEGLIWQARAILLGKFGKDQLRLLNNKYIFHFKEATLVRTLGMQPEGFWSYADALFYKGQLLKYDGMGMISLDGESAADENRRAQSFYSPGAAEHNRGKRKDEFGSEVKDGDPYRNDKYLSYKPTPVTFEMWCQQMMKVFGHKGMNAIATVILAVFKDIVASYEKVPIPYGYGDAESGKSAWAERIFYFFFDRELKPYNLNSGTIFSFFNTMERFRNCAYVFNEFDEDQILEEFFRAFKQAFDGEGRNKGLMGGSVRNKSVEQPINVLPVLIGQILTTKDGGSVLTRCVPEKFIGRTYTDEEKSNLDVIMKWEKEGLNGLICELLPHRGQFRKDFFIIFNQILSQLKTDINKEGQVYKERIARNHGIMLTCAKLMGQHFKIGFEFETYYQYALGSIINLTQMVNESNNLGIFWKEVMFMFEQQLIEDGFDYRIVTLNEIEVSVTQEGRKVNVVKKFEAPKKLLLLRLTSIFPLFESRIKQSSGTKSINQKTLTTYFESNKAYIGNNPGQKFKSEKKNISQTTSSYVFEYDALGLNLERNTDADEITVEELTGRIIKHPESIDMGSGFTSIKFTVMQHKQEGIPLKTITTYTNCFLPGTMDPGIKNEDVVTLKGNLRENKFTRQGKQMVSRIMDVTEISVGTPATGNEPQNEPGNDIKDEDLPF